MARGRGNKELGAPRRSGIIWDDSNASNVAANVFKVTAVRGELQLFFGERHKSDADRNILRFTRQILLNPYTAKRLAAALQDAVRRYESLYGPIDEKTTISISRKPVTPPLPLPPFKSRKAVEGVVSLFEILKNLDLPVALERSFKVSEKKLSANRFLVAFEPKSVRQNSYENILRIGALMDMPEKFLGAFERDLPEATLIGFGIEEDEETCIVKAYLEFRNRYEEAMRKKPDQPDPYVSHLGFKWDAADNTRGALARYTCFPTFTARDILERLSNTFYRQHDRTPFEILKGVVDLGSKKVGRDKFLYLEVNEENNPRSSFDINMYGANFRLEELCPFLLEMCRHYSISDQQFRSLYDPVRTRTFGHIAGGMDRKGRDFLTLYFGE